MLDLYHVTMCIATDNVVLPALMSRAGNDFFRSEQLLWGNSFNIARRAAARADAPEGRYQEANGTGPHSIISNGDSGSGEGRVLLSKELGRVNVGVTAYAMREMLCGLEICGMDIVADRSSGWVQMQIGTELGGSVVVLQCGDEGGGAAGSTGQRMITDR